jgi:hypothetical protein
VTFSGYTLAPKYETAKRVRPNTYTNGSSGVPRSLTARKPGSGSKPCPDRNSHMVCQSMRPPESAMW